MLKILTAADLHLSDKPPSNCTDSYNDDLFTMLEEVVSIAKAQAVDAMVFAGDLFHLKQANRTSHRTVMRMADVVQAFSCPVYLIIGNHDIQFDRIDSVHETQPFGMLLKAGAHLLSGWANPDLPLYGVSWQQDWNGPDTSSAFYDWINEIDQRWSGEALLVTHAPIYPPGEELPWENIPAWTIAEMMGRIGYCYYGHVHSCHGMFETNGVTFCNQGALSRGSLHEDDLKRKPAVTMWSSGSVGFERVELTTAPPVEQVFRLADHAEVVDYRERLGAFLASVRESSITVTSIESVLESIRGMGLPVGYVNLAEEVLTAAVSGELK